LKILAKHATVRTMEEHISPAEYNLTVVLKFKTRTLNK